MTAARPTYAADTKVPVSRSRAEIERLLERYGADAFGYGQDGTIAAVTFRLDGRMMRVVIEVPDDPKFQRARWRSLVLIVKAKLEAVAAGIETVDQAWMPYILLPDGSTVGQHMTAQIEQTYTDGQMPPLLPGLGRHLNP